MKYRRTWIVAASLALLVATSVAAQDKSLNERIGEAFSRTWESEEALIKANTALERAEEALFDLAEINFTTLWIRKTDGRLMANKGRRCCVGASTRVPNYPSYDELIDLIVQQQVAEEENKKAHESLRELRRLQREQSSE